MAESSPRCFVNNTIHYGGIQYVLVFGIKQMKKTLQTPFHARIIPTHDRLRVLTVRAQSLTNGLLIPRHALPLALLIAVQRREEGMIGTEHEPINTARVDSSLQPDVRVYDGVKVDLLL
ncbi:hypothetical protein NUW58_g10362 [Xylaria curta]|uniref:Uncharacterized protein n=1 Tax=Xylaria curta TaxID=42375 RepID=A0ACC1MLA4_9PEZI|nr:hypothetical protein NUW58_g10362 [Xylaria curta]